MAAPTGACRTHTRPIKGVCSASVATTPSVGASAFVAARRRHLELKSPTTTTASALPRPHSSPQGQLRGLSEDRGSGNGGIAGKKATIPSTMTAALAPATTQGRKVPARRPQPLSPPPPSHQHRLPAWLGSAVRRAVLSLDEAPLLVVKTRINEDDGFDAFSSSSPAFTTHALPKAALSAPALWPAIAETVVAPEGKEPEALLLVHKIEDKDEEEVSSSSLAPSSQRHHHHLRLSDFEALERGGIATAELAGRVGDCCHGEEEEASGTSSSGSEGNNFIDSDLRALIAPRSPSSRSSSSPSSHWSSSSASSDTDVAFYGVVVQTTPREKRRRGSSSSSPSSPFSYVDGDDSNNKDLSSAAGCFVLKTVRTRSSSPGGCTCVYYSLTRVGRAGEPLAEQLKRSWLV